ncbi:MAG: aminotransferase class I/II-fold pyridoxal phosphate-dependent enzyme [Clostridia bacterium]
MDYDKVVNPRVAAVPPSGIRKFFDIVSNMPDAISLGVGEPDFVTPYAYRHAAIQSILEGMTQYTSNWGRIQLREAIAEYLDVRYGLQYDPQKEILVTVGASEGIDIALRSLICADDEVLIPEPSYVSYMPCVVVTGGLAVPLVTEADSGFRLTAQALRNAITPRTKALILPYPNNPTGAIMERAELEALAEVLRNTNIMVISDEIYSELTYGETRHVSFASIPGMWERTITLNGFSKAFAMTGWRVGYACGPRELMQLMVKIHQYTIMCASTQGQMAAEAGLRINLQNDFADVATMVRSYDRRRRLMLDAFRTMGLDCFEPRGAFYAFPSIARTGLTSQAFCEQLLKEQSVACVPGDAFGRSGEGFIRCCYATAVDKLTEALGRIASFMQAHQA